MRIEAACCKTFVKTIQVPAGPLNLGRVTLLPQ
jgi:hypothetical protein